jgi:hypothetical protein
MCRETGALLTCGQARGLQQLLQCKADTVAQVRARMQCQCLRLTRELQLEDRLAKQQTQLDHALEHHKLFVQRARRVHHFYCPPAVNGLSQANAQ